ncbi:hypothetical protein [Rhodococcus sp. NCIMB 12038]|uniref:hypothetical protein n=1 Tax=Rhodococcus sp. NCIMB 12038 TaxID=933800 RepID=UPI000B3C20E7|nr:hypothetical protein [Rhodococcus sp. NCIMB 12038]OUS97706.1 hypothetical protein CA951_01415 [Rhodococcus sp. NCIMB 12038]
MGVAGAARAFGRLQYRPTCAHFHLFDDVVMPALFDDGAPARLAYEWALIECDTAAAILFDDDVAAAHAQKLRQRSAALRYAIAPGQRQIARDTEAVTLERHRARFRERHHRHAGNTD